MHVVMLSGPCTALSLRPGSIYHITLDNQWTKLISQTKTTFSPSPPFFLLSSSQMRSLRRDWEKEQKTAVIWDQLIFKTIGEVCRRGALSIFFFRQRLGTHRKVIVKPTSSQGLAWRISCHILRLDGLSLLPERLVAIPISILNCNFDSNSRKFKTRITEEMGAFCTRYYKSPFVLSSCGDFSQDLTWRSW